MSEKEDKLLFHMDGVCPLGEHSNGEKMRTTIKALTDRCADKYMYIYIYIYIYWDIENATGG